MIGTGRESLRMVEFVTLYLGLVSGVIPVELSVDPAVAAVEIMLDGRLAATLQDAPWRAECDLGDALRPHELLAVARDGEDRELGRARQWLNVPRPRAEAGFRLERASESGRAVAALFWQSPDYAAPEEVSIFLDGRPLEAPDPTHIPLPQFDPEEIHFLRADLFFSDTVQAGAELVFGGRYRDQVTADLTAVPALWRGRGLPQPDRMAGWLSAGGEPLRVVAVERPAADLYLVRELTDSNLDALGTLAGVRRTQIGAGVEIPAGLAPGDRLRAVFPRASIQRRGEGPVFHLMQSSADISNVADGTLFSILTAAFFSRVETPLASQRLADAVATAGLLAAGASRPRAVILIRSGDSEDASHFAVEAARSYLRSVHVPLFLWTPFPEAAQSRPSAWGQGRDVSSLNKFADAIGELRSHLDSQIVIWVEGAHLPSDISFSPAIERLRPVG